MAFDDMAAVVATVLAAADDAFISLDLLPEGVLAAGENKTHDDEMIAVVPSRSGLNTIGSRRSCFGARSSGDGVEDAALFGRGSSVRCLRVWECLRQERKR